MEVEVFKTFRWILNGGSTREQPQKAATFLLYRSPKAQMHKPLFEVEVVALGDRFCRLGGEHGEMGGSTLHVAPLNEVGRVLGAWKRVPCNKRGNWPEKLRFFPIGQSVLFNVTGSYVSKRIWLKSIFCGLLGLPGKRRQGSSRHVSAVNRTYTRRLDSWTTLLHLWEDSYLQTHCIAVCQWKHGMKSFCTSNICSHSEKQVCSFEGTCTPTPSGRLVARWTSLTLQPFQCSRPKASRGSLPILFLFFFKLRRSRSGLQRKVTPHGPHTNPTTWDFRSWNHVWSVDLQLKLSATFFHWRLPLVWIVGQHIWTKF